MRALTFLWDDVQRDGQPSVLDELHDVGMGHADDGLSVDGQDAVAHLEAPAAVCGAGLDDAADLMGHSWDGGRRT